MPGRFDSWTALVTGASAGLGAEFARQLAPKLGAGRLVLAARRADRLETLAAALRAAHPALRVDIAAGDVADPSFVPDSIDLLVNNAGLGDLGLFEDAAWDKTRAQLQVNVEALTRLTHAVLPGMVARGRGAVINVGSVAGIMPLPTFAVYAATKAYVNSFSEALHWEVKAAGVTVTAVCPGPIHTEFGAVANREGGARLMGSSPLVVISSAQCVVEALRAAETGKPRVVTGLGMKLGALGMRLLPLELLRLVYRFTVAPKTAGLRKSR